MNRQDIVLGRRIVVRGVTGSGKSTLARALGDALGLTVIELDAINWQRPGWNALPSEEFRSQIEAAMHAATNGWVSDGNYTKEAAALLDSADTFVWLHLPWRVSFYRMVTRTLRRALSKELLWGAQHESLRTQLFSKDSLWWWGIHHHKASVRSTRAVLAARPHVPVIELRSAREVRALMEAAKRSKVG